MKKNTDNKEPQEESEEIVEETPAVFLDTERILRLVESIENDARTLRGLLTHSSAGFTPVSPSFFPAGLSPTSHDLSLTTAPVGFLQNNQLHSEEDDAIEGIFDGERMFDAQGKSYQVPPNYASKSKLVEGDPLKLYITKEGKYLYKQLGPIERRTIPGTLRMEGNHYVVDTDEGTTYNILTACVTYYISLYNLKPEDKVMITIPADKAAKWAVIDNLL